MSKSLLVIVEVILRVKRIQTEHNFKRGWKATPKSVAVQLPLFWFNVLLIIYIIPIGLDNQINVNIFLPISLNICFGCSKVPSH